MIYCALWYAVVDRDCFLQDHILVILSPFLYLHYYVNMDLVVDGLLCSMYLVSKITLHSNFHDVEDCKYLLVDYKKSKKLCMWKSHLLDVMIRLWLNYFTSLIQSSPVQIPVQSPGFMSSFFRYWISLLSCIAQLNSELLNGSMC